MKLTYTQVDHKVWYAMMKINKSIREAVITDLHLECVRETNEHLSPSLMTVCDQLTIFKTR